MMMMTRMMMRTMTPTTMMEMMIINKSNCIGVSLTELPKPRTFSTAAPMAKCAVVMIITSIITNTYIIAFVVIFITNLLNSGPDDKVGSGEDEESTGE